MLLCLVLGICLALTCTATGQNTNPLFVEEESYYPDLDFYDAFDWRLLKEFSTKYQNVLLSPISIKLILALLYQGSSAATEREFQNVLQFSDKTSANERYSQLLNTLHSSQRSEYLLNMGTRIFLDSQIQVNDRFETTARQYYRTDLQQTNFLYAENASRVINSWIEKLTNGKVSELVDPDDLKQTIMLIANAVYFKGTWRHPFPKNQTQQGTFYISGDTVDNMLSVNVPFMSTKDQFFIKESDQLDAKILRLPYKGSDYSMFIILPNSKGGLPFLLKKINLNNLSSLLHTMEKRLVDVNIPKFKFVFQTGLKDVLRRFGLNQMFQNTASFTGITKGNNTLLRMLVVSEILQKSGIELDEEGSVVYSATNVNIGNKFGESKDVFNATHPFVFFIEGPNGSILFIGKVENPLEESQLPSRFADDDDDPTNSQASSAQLFPPNYPSNQYPNSQYPNNPYPNSQYPNSQNSVSGGIHNNPNIVQNIVPVSDVSKQPEELPNLDPSNYIPASVDKDEFNYRFNWFDLELLAGFSDVNTNVFISPASIKTTLAMILEGAYGTCAEEISDALRLPSLDQVGVREVLQNLLNNLNDKYSGSTILQSSNAVFPSDKYRVKDKYRDVIERFYDGRIKSVNYKNLPAAVQTINNWVTDATSGAIREIVGPQSLSSETSVVIANALYFKGKWKTVFNVKDTKPKCFNARSGCVYPQMMHVSDKFNYNYISRIRAHVVEIPYQEKYSMLIILPSEDVNVGSVARDLHLFRLQEILKELKPTEIILEIPKFGFEYSTDMVEYLKPLRIREIFTNRANLSGIIDKDNVLVNSLLHKTKIDVDEQGTVAAASSSAIVIPLMGSSAVVADRPFVFCIYHQDSGNIIFEGILRDPLEQAPSAETAVHSRNAGRNNLKSSIRTRTQFS